MGSFPALRGGVVTEHPIVDAILDRYRAELGGEYAAYRNHVLRCFNYHSLLMGEALPDSAALAWAIHDLGVWTANTMDYLGPSAALAGVLLDQFGIVDADSVRRMVMDHHRIRPIKGDKLVETFRIADRVDASLGIWRTTIPRATVREVVAQLPYERFHWIVILGNIRHVLKHPTRPAPMMRW